MKDFQSLHDSWSACLILTPRKRIIFYKLEVAQLFKEFSLLYETLRFIIVFTTDQNSVLSKILTIRPYPHMIFI
jgi:hypothetical protein